ncbi:MAG TPA: heme NO-binding domain-containing protein [Patescibacteria group bacterium]|nr:heme NO-binding domain-containing protein [Patescibacteria group bacterium]
MHGSIFVLLKKFVETRYDVATWHNLLRSAGIDHEYFLHQTYPDKEAAGIIAAAVSATGLKSNTLLEDFGEFMVPDLMKVYAKYIKPEWRTFEMLEFTESVMHKAARQENPGTQPPVLNAMRVNPSLLIIDYYSKRRMGSLAIGIIRGIARYYHEEDIITITSTTESDAERVQIRVHKDHSNHATGHS